jgi:hypothetical protein
VNLRLGRKVEDGSELTLDADRLTTHGVILGMTGSGKTGLAMVLLEELIEAGVPLLLIDPKGDLANLGLLFADASAADLTPWTDAAAAQRSGQTPEEAATQWGQQLRAQRAEWGIDAPRVAALRDRLDLRVYTPGSLSGEPVNLLGSLGRPDAATLDDPEARVEWVTGLVQGLLALVEVTADPVRSPEAVVLAQIIDAAWEAQQDLTFEELVVRLADPPFKKVGVFPLESFYPSKERLELAMKFNALLASAAFSSWSKGAPLDPAAWQKPRQPAKVPVSVFYLAHLNDAQRMFFVSLCLHRLRTWSRALPGTSSLRCLLYFDEVAGYMPPHPAAPASKAPLLTLLKQSRAVGVGIVLATQNPVDLDYKGLANTGTWLIGRMQTAQDRARVAEGLTAAGWDGAQLRAEFEKLEQRIFLVKSPALDVPVRFQTRAAMALLRGPLTRAELATVAPVAAVAPAGGTEAAPAPPSQATPEEPGLSSQPPALGPGMIQAFLDTRTVFSAQLEGVLERWAEPRRSDGKTLWRPALWGELQVRFDESKGGFLLDETHHYVFFPVGDSLPQQWLRLPLEAEDVLSEPGVPSVFQPLPGAFDEAREFKAAQQAMLQDVYQRVTSSQWVQPDLKLYGAGGENREAFVARVEAVIEERVDRQLAKLQGKVHKEVDDIQARIAKLEQRADTLRSESQRRQTESLFSAGTALLGFFTGKRTSALKSVLSSHHRTGSANDRVSQAESEIQGLQQRMLAVREELETEIERVRATERQALQRIEERPVRLGRSDIRVSRFGVLWIPVSRRV